uniref:Branched-chain amino acid aminotransferase n=1 Tax=Schlesneria paludicola TaxID=360056 RepID=A0A7C2NYP8_9PLAN
MLQNTLAKLYRDEAGYIVSAELVLVATIAVLALVVGLSEVAHAVNDELEDVASAFGNLSQTYQVYGTSGHKGNVNGSSFYDTPDFCDNPCDIVSTPAVGENI